MRSGVGLRERRLLVQTVQANTAGPTEARANPVMDVQEVADLFGVTKPTIYRRIQRGEIPVIRFGARVLVPRAKLAEMLSVGGEEI